jgi:hypothetical protein
MSERVAYFAFGSNMSRARLVARIGEVEVLGHARLPDHVHRFSKRGADGTGKGNVEPAPGHTAHGVLYRVDVDQLEALAEFEGGYRRVEIGVLYGEAEVVALTFVAIAPGEAPAPSAEYLAHYRRGIAEHGLPSDYLADWLDPP